MITTLSRNDCMIPFLKKNASTGHYPVSQPSPSPRLWRRGRLGSAQGLVDPWVRRDPSHCKKERRLKAADSTHPRTGCFSCRTEPKQQKPQSVPPKKRHQFNLRAHLAQVSHDEPLIRLNQGFHSERHYKIGSSRKCVLGST